MDNYTVYKHTAPNGKVYIGITSCSVERRWQRGKNYQNNKHFTKAIKKYGWDNIEHQILFTGLSKENAEQKEIELISEYQSSNPIYGYNVENGGNATGKLSEETKKKISNSLKGKHYKKRRNHTEEEKKAISEKLIGRTSPMKGKHWTEEQKANVGTSIICVNTSEIVYSIREAARKTGCDRAAITKVLKGSYKQTGGLKFEYTKKQSLSVL